MILVDFSQIMYASIFAQSKGSAITDESLLKHMVYNSLRKIKQKFGAKYGRMVLCFDSGNTWRNDYFKHYKAERKAKRALQPDEDMAAMFKFIGDIQHELIEIGPYICMKVDRCEADDVIAILARESDESVLIVSNDRDFIQLIDKNVSVYHQSKDELVSLAV